MVRGDQSGGSIEAKKRLRETRCPNNTLNTWFAEATPISNFG